MRNIQRKSLVLGLTAFLSILNYNAGWAKSADEKVKDCLQDTQEVLRSSIDSLGDDLEAIQTYLDNYHWKGVVRDEVSSGPATLRNLQLNGHARSTIVKPGEKIHGSINCDLDRSKCSAVSWYRVILGIPGEGAKVTIGNELGLVAGVSQEEFSLSAPMEPGLYEIRFRLSESLLDGTMKSAWHDKKGHEPDATTTIGVILVKP